LRQSADAAPLLHDDIVGVVASFMNIFDLRRSFIRVCKQWHAIGMVIAKGAAVAAQIHKFILGNL